MNPIRYLIQLVTNIAWTVLLPVQHIPCCAPHTSIQSPLTALSASIPSHHTDSTPWHNTLSASQWPFATSPPTVNRSVRIGLSLTGSAPVCLESQQCRPFPIRVAVKINLSLLLYPMLVTMHCCLECVRTRYWLYAFASSILFGRSLLKLPAYSFHLLSFESHWLYR